MNKKLVFWVYWIATSLVCAGFLAGAAVYTFNHDMVAHGMQQLGYPVYLTYLLPVVKVLGPLAILSRVSWPPAISPMLACFITCSWRFQPTSHPACRAGPAP